MGSGLKISSFGAQISGFGVSDFGVQFSGFGLQVSGFEFRAWGPLTGQARKRRKAMCSSNVSPVRRSCCSGSAGCLSSACQGKSGFKVQGSGFRVQGSGFRVQGSGLIQGAGFRIQGTCVCYRSFRARGPCQEGAQGGGWRPRRTQTLRKRALAQAFKSRGSARHHARPFVGASQVRSWSRWCGLGAILWAFIAKN